MLKRASLFLFVLAAAATLTACTDRSSANQHFVPQTVQRHQQDTIGGGPLQPPPGH